jgi:hypothetical protein
MMKNPQLLTEVRHPEPLETLVESKPVKDGMKLSEISSISHGTGISWTDVSGLGWLFCEDWS